MTPLAERDVRDWVRIAGRCAAETVDLLTQVLDAIPSGMPAVVELAAEWSDGLDQTEELAERVRAARDAAPLTAPPEADSAAETLERIRQIVAEWEAMRVDLDVERTDNDTDAIHAIADLLRGGA